MNGRRFLKMLEEIQAISYRAVGGRGVGTELRHFVIGLFTAHATEIGEAVQAYKHTKTAQEIEAEKFQKALNGYYAACSTKGYESKTTIEDKDITKAAGLLKFAKRYRNQHTHSLGHFQKARAAFNTDRNDTLLYKAAPEWTPA